MENIDKEELYSLIKESVKANTTNAETTKAVGITLRELKKNMCRMNDSFTLHNLSQTSIKKEMIIIRKQLLRWLFICIIVIFTLLGGIIFTKSLGLDIIELINY